MKFERGNQLELTKDLYAKENPEELSAKKGTKVIFESCNCEQDAFVWFSPGKPGFIPLSHLKKI